MPDRETVLLVTISNWTGLSRLPQAFAQAGFRVTVFAPARFLVSCSGYVDEVVDVPEHPREFVTALQTFMESRSHEFAYCLTCDDNLLYGLYHIRTQPWTARLFPAPLAGDGLRFLLSKQVFPILCTQHQLPIPRTAVSSVRADLLAAGEKLGYPLILKDENGFAGLGVHSIHNAEALKARLETLPPQRRVTLQQFVPGTVGGVSAVWVQGRLKSWFAFLKVGTWPTPFSPACVIRLVDRPQLLPILQKLGEISGFNGLGGIDFIEQADGAIRLLEQHARPTPTFLFAEKAGIDLSRALQALVTQDRDAEPQSPCIRDRHWIPLFPQEAFRMIERGQWRRMPCWLTVPRYREQLFPEDGPLFAMTLELLKLKAERKRPA